MSIETGRPGFGQSTDATSASWRNRRAHLRHAQRLNARDAVQLWLLPGLAAVLPWSICFAVYRRLARWPWLYRQQVDAEAAQAMRRGFLSAPEVDTWRTERRLVSLIDHADFFLSRTRSSRWLRRHVRVTGDWPAGDQPAILCTFHWGAGTWALRHAHTCGVRARMLVAGLQSPAYAGRPLMFAYGRRRVQMIARELGLPTLDASASMRSVLQTLQQGQQVMAVVDVPADEADAACAVDLLGAQAQVPRALWRLAVQRQLPVAVYTCGIDLANGKRWLNLETIAPGESAPLLAQQVFDRLDRAIRAHPTLWHFWSQAERIWPTAQPPQTRVVEHALK